MPSLHYGSSNWPPSSPQHSQPFAGSEMAMGQALGRLEAGQERTIFVLEIAVDEIKKTRELLAELLRQSKPAPKPEDRLTVKDWLQIAIAMGVLLAAIAGKLPLKDVLGLVLKPLGS